MSLSRTSDPVTSPGAAFETVARSASSSVVAHERLDDHGGARAFGPGRPGNLVVAPEGAVYATALLRSEARGVHQFGQRLLAQVESQDLLLTELRRVLTSMADEAVSGTPGTMQRLARTATEIVDWCEAVQLELQNEGSRAIAGAQAIDLLELVHDLGGARPEREIVVRGSAPFAAWGSVTALGRVVRLALELVDARTGGAGHLHIEIGYDDEGHYLSILGQGKAVGDPSHDRVEEFRDATESAGVQVVPDPTTEGRTGLQLRLATGSRGPLLQVH